MSRDDGGHPLLTTVGVAAVAVGVLFVVQPGLAAAVGVDYAAALLVGLIALVQAARTVQARRASDVRGAETPDVEAVETVPTPGDEFDETVADLRSGPRRVLVRERADLHDRIEEAAVTAVAERENCSREAARERVADGTWTDDIHAAAFLGGDDAPNVPLVDRLKLAASAESTFQLRLRRTADAVARTAGVDATGAGGTDAADGPDASATADSGDDESPGAGRAREVES
ncbi:DUF7269 family protein [Halorussus halobius]|uniref:DUF7269 family protein n=1 Tax=Halorussus halobius TaxID=1710537 RepID=UPI0010930D34|nr:hypothetical protein [Halorussus halobius]